MPTQASCNPRPSSQIFKVGGSFPQRSSAARVPPKFLLHGKCQISNVHAYIVAMDKNILMIKLLTNHVIGSLQHTWLAISPDAWAHLQ